MGTCKIGKAIQTRFIIGGMIGFASLILSIIRSNISIIILAMTKNPYNSSIEMPDFGIRYEWSTYEQSLVIGSYFWGNTVICLIAGVCAERYGARKILGFSFGMTAILSILSPIGAQFLWTTILIRFLTGVMMGAVIPSAHALVANWSPTEEKGKFLSMLTFSGIGAVIGWSMSGHIIEQYGWKYVFYVVGVIIGIYSVLLFIFIYDSPNKHPRIKIKERKYILSKLNTTFAGKKPWPPFRAILSSIPFWALVCFQFGNLNGFYLLLTCVPRYLNEVHSFNITSTGMLASVPFILIVPFGILFGYIGDLLLKNGTMTPNAIRKWFSIFSHFIPGCALACITFIGHKPYMSLAFITVALCFNSAVVVTSVHNAHDLAPNFATTLFGLISFVGSAAGYLSPLLVAYFTEERSTEEEWQKVFFVGSGLFIGSAIVFALFGSGYVQEWNNISNDAAPDIGLNTTERQAILTIDGTQEHSSVIIERHDHTAKV